MHIICSDLEGVFIPEIWINVAERTGISELRLTTRDISDYDELMTHRLKVLDAHGLKLQDIQAVIATMEPLPGAFEFVRWLREQSQLIVVSDTFLQFAAPLMEKLNRPTLFCHELEVAADGRITAYKLRQKDAKRKTVNALKSLDYTVLAFGDSYNDTGMLEASDFGFFFQPPDNVIKDFPQFPVTRDYETLKDFIRQSLKLT
ncbi:bifunctional phosphoserine phosphatase/homoserine phosphotransferase ThrH [Desulfobotulus sp. H1]|uniref:phosphoserine phosphatase n=1 Tax=Desulfobotulus pelophilus TaxID=2823377 RepID=A0ABT3N839_9BACT|nr:bifunctional phosphoserine phosphatase/homoserine phosphotransferase ThrH [Desulfobotulus pelophilus]MCW7753621.1 bifunctional phosphoserine phosphatase/homoserine phosphotransferase ThrH [Desulfobotulus pelophilus]